MKKRIKKLRLSRETLRKLSGADLKDANGGHPPPDHRSQVYSACPLDCEGGPIYTGPFYEGCPSYGNCTFGCY
jgi:hypothetical protein